MLVKLIEFIRQNHPNTNVGEWLDSKYIHLNNTQLKKIADAYHNGSINTKPATKCPAKQLILHFGNTLILFKKSNNAKFAYHAELAWETDFLSIHSTRNKDKGFHFINFAFDNHYQAKLLPTQKTLKQMVTDKKGNQEIMNKSMLIVKAFLSAIS